MAGWGAQLLDWLDNHAFPAEQAFADRAHADAVTALQAALRFERDWTVLASAARTVLDSQCLLPHEEAAARAVLNHMATR